MSKESLKTLIYLLCFILILEVIVGFVIYSNSQATQLASAEPVTSEAFEETDIPEETEDVEIIEAEEVQEPIQEESIEVYIEPSVDEVYKSESQYIEPEYVEAAYTPEIESYEPEVKSSYYNTYTGDFYSDGIVYGEDGTRYTWYSQNVLPGSGLYELNSNGRHVNDSGFVCDGDGYIAVASSDHAIGTIVSTPFGDAKVYDTGCASGTIDIYTNY